MPQGLGVAWDLKGRQFAAAAAVAVQPISSCISIFFLPNGEDRLSGGTRKDRDSSNAAAALREALQAWEALYGDVWLCEDVRHGNRLVAVKQINIMEARRALHVDRHMDNPADEKRAIQRLRQAGLHNNILEFHDEFLENGCLHIVMEYCDGGDLLDVLHSMPDRRFRESVALHYFRQVAAGVHFLHSHGIAHRDLSLENVLLRQNVAKLCDFGLSTSTDRVCHEPVGKAYYMAPEVVGKLPYDPAAADIWSLGIMLFIMLSGSPLAPCASTMDKTFLAFQAFGVKKILEAWGLRGAVSDGVTRLLEGMLQIDPAKRVNIEDVLFHPVVVHR
ncbi:TPA: hypothetical protein N0F65_012563 [Lagenidium giganteum]|uniref:Protein kinase domain-containing protein n=1 Tax=Lagenidium giganteum TaxID=4803 RepID=A0AAV2YMQ2_9STRA|nr:TPA: hypothetical protein N0F65_012563 [Lagenidium giganteum]